MALAADPSNHQPGTRAWLAAVILAARYGRLRITPELFDGVSYEPPTALALIHAQQRAGRKFIQLGGIIEGNLVMNGTIEGGLSVHGTITHGLSIRKGGIIEGNLVMNGTITGDLVVGGTIEGGLWIGGTTITGHYMGGSIEGDLWVDGTITRDLLMDGILAGDLLMGGSIEGDLSVSRIITGDLLVGGSIEGDLSVSRIITGDLLMDGILTGDLLMDGSIEGDLSVGGSIQRDLLMVGTIEGGLWVGGSIQRDLLVVGTIADYLSVVGAIEGELVVTGWVSDEISLTGRFDSNVALTPEGHLRLQSVRTGRFKAPVYIGDHVDISKCDFRQCTDIARFELVGSDLFPPGSNGLSKTPGDSGEKILAHEMASIYRQLRAGLEDRKNRPDASRFYRWEMDARRDAAKEKGKGRRLEYAVLWAYHLVSMYGQSVWRPAFAFLVVSIIGWRIFAVNGLDPDPVIEPSPGAAWHEEWMFAVRSMLSFLNPPNADLTTADLLGQIMLRFTGPALIALAVLGIRDKVAR